MRIVSRARHFPHLRIRRARHFTDLWIRCARLLVYPRVRCPRTLSDARIRRPRRLRDVRVSCWRSRRIARIGPWRFCRRCRPWRLGRSGRITPVVIRRSRRLQRLIRRRCSRVHVFVSSRGIRCRRMLTSLRADISSLADIRRRSRNTPRACGQPMAHHRRCPTRRRRMFGTNDCDLRTVVHHARSRHTGIFPGRSNLRYTHGPGNALHDLPRDTRIACIIIIDHRNVIDDARVIIDSRVLRPRHFVISISVSTTAMEDVA